MFDRDLLENLKKKGYKALVPQLIQHETIKLSQYFIVLFKIRSIDY